MRQANRDAQNFDRFTSDDTRDMKTSQAIAVGLLLAAALAPRIGVTAESEPQQVEVAGSLDAEWAGYRYAYEAATFIDKFLRKRPLIQAPMQLRPVDPATPMTGLKVRLVGKTTDIELVANDGHGAEAEAGL